MEKKAIISFVAIVVTMLMVIPLAFGAIGSVTIRDNEITFTDQNSLTHVGTCSDSYFL